ncbi:alpha/beta hydrolase [Stakelama pacifica]|uniref:Acetyl esterase/lipase n=1 Tax=Stakelama pacifica TaxID=517720 RepID=A0A4R6FJE1_9SPHN|nr:alpha/beta hydrolase [Stakelama pacifica]TDN80654.1 acetyl esterase/lipase [Stakelama pacifica]GGO97530.1 carboxylesterase [Stakelama pacifica]
MSRRTSFLAISIAALLAACSPPKLLSTLDSVSGGGAGTKEAVSGAPFGSHGQKLDVWVPKNGGTRPKPVVVFFYGGGWVKGTRQGYAFAGRAFASKGFVTVVPDYRKVPDVRFPAFVEDGAQAMKWVEDHIVEYGGDPNRVAIVGHSAGAYSVAMLALDREFLAKAGVAPGFVKAGVGLSGPYDFLPLTDKRAVDALGNWPDPKATQPISYARDDAPPMLLITSTKDEVVKPRNAVALAKRLRELGAPVAFREYTGLTHENVAMALSKPFRGKAPVLADTVAFIDKALAEKRNEAQPAASRPQG